MIEGSESGRAFRQEHGLRFDHTPSCNNYFASLKSPRRSALATEINLALIAAAPAHLPDRLADISELDAYECFAAAGHWHKGAAHAPRHNDAKGEARGCPAGLVN